ncbi:MAG: Tetratricopeptide TPR 1 repeat-containing protein, partial [Candidatus Rokubacteria bacterium]|nr:Tetratricopeptide TPR 1 repeat-containing protein [Candidatus Rokubacteria bacterium]
MDYYVSDAVVVPQEDRGLYAEEVIYLPCGACYEAPEYAPAVSSLPVLCGKPFTFGCINRIEKISARVIALWGRILAALPEAGLLIKGSGLDDPELRRGFVCRLRDAGIGAERVRLAGASAHADHLKIYYEVDLGLDPFPHGGGISTAEALWMGVPVVTLAGSTVTSRLSASILTALEMQDWIAHSDDEYVRIAVEAARDLPRLARTREQLRSRAAGSIFRDVQRYTREVERAYRSMWRRWCAREAAGPFDVAAGGELKAATGAPSAGPSQRALGDLGALVSANRNEEAEALARQMVETWPDLPEAHNDLGNALRALGRLSEAQASYRRALQLKPDFHTAHNALGNTLLALGRLSEAEVSYRRALELSPQFHMAHNNLGVVLRELGRLLEAEECFRRAVELKPDYHMAHSNLGDALRDLARPSEAEACYRRALDLRPDLHGVHNNHGVVLNRLGRSSEAEASYRRATELRPDFHQAHNNLGAALQALDRPIEAEASYRRALELKPDYPEAHFNLADVLRVCGRLSEA